MLVILLTLGAFGAGLSLRAQGRDAGCLKKTSSVVCIGSPYLPSWVVFDLELRGRTEGTSAINAQPNSSYAYELTRIHGGMRLVPNQHVSAYLQFHDTHALGLPLNKVQSNMHDSFDLRQGYVQLDAPDLRVRIGRQELRFGGERLIGISDWANNSRTFDGATLQIGRENQVELFSTSVVAIHPTSLDTHGTGLTFHGVYGSISSLIPGTTLQPFVFVKAIPSVAAGDLKAGSELQVTGGVELDGALHGSWDYQFVAALQRGRFAVDEIDAGAFLGKLGYRVQAIPWKPHFSAEFDYATGNHPERPKRHGTFDQQYPSNHNAFGLVDLFGFQNLMEGRLQCEVRPTRAMSLLVQGEVLQLAARRDSLYASSGVVLSAAPLGGFASGKIGKEFDVSTRYGLPSGLLLQGGLGYFMGDGVFAQTKLNGTELLGYLSLTWNLSLERRSR